MKRYGYLLLIFALLALAGCAAYKPAQLTVSHPAHPEAMVAPERPLSKTLAYTRSDMPSAQPVSAGVAARQKGHGSRPTEGGPGQTVVGEGKVVATVPNTSQVVVEHGEIKGFMEAMTMGYRIDPPSLLEGLKSGDKIRFTVDVEKKAIIKIEKMN